jgi:hypothetical protein
MNETVPDAYHNLEKPLRATRLRPEGINYRIGPENADTLVAAPSVLHARQHHILDWGRAGLVDT